MMIHLKDIPFLEDIPSGAMDNVFVRDIMTTPVIVLHHQESYTNIRRILQGCKHNGFPVVKADLEDQAKLGKGLAAAAAAAAAADDDTQDDKLTQEESMLRSGSASPVAEEPQRRVYVRLCGVILREHLERFVALAPPDSRDTLLIDVTRHMNETPFTVQPDFTMTQAFRCVASACVCVCVCVCLCVSVCVCVCVCEFMNMSCHEPFPYCLPPWIGDVFADNSPYSMQHVPHAGFAPPSCCRQKL
jgi:CBS domain-containing protein